LALDDLTATAERGRCGPAPVEAIIEARRPEGDTQKQVDQSDTGSSYGHVLTSNNS